MADPLVANVKAIVLDLYILTWEGNISSVTKEALLFRLDALCGLLGMPVPLEPKPKKKAAPTTLGPGPVKIKGKPVMT